MSQAIIWNQWRANKMSNECCLRDLIRSRDPRSPLVIAAFETIQKKERVQNMQDEIRRVQQMLQEKQKAFVSHPLIETWLEQYTEANYGVLSRFQLLALVGGSQQGKTSKALSIFGVHGTLKVSCQSCPSGVLPSLAGFDRTRHKCVVFDECRVDQILANREFFQASAHVQQMSQSLCNQHMYEIWCYQTAFVVCCNDMATSEDDGLSASDADWMAMNVVVVRLGQGQTWYIK